MPAEHTKDQARSIELIIAPIHTLFVVLYILRVINVVTGTKRSME